MRVIILALFVALAISQPINGELSGNLEQLTQYFNGVFGFFGLNQTDLTACVANNEEAQTFFTFTGLNYEVSVAFTNGERVQFLFLIGKLQVVEQSLQGVLKCIGTSSDFNALQQAAGFNTEDHSLDFILQQLYNQAHFNDYSYAYTPIYGQLENGEYSSAGFHYGKMYQVVAQNTSVNNWWYNQYKGFENGIFWFLNLSSPFQLSNCYTNVTAQTGFDLYFDWAQVVGNSSIVNVVANSNTFFNGEGAALISQLESMWQCFSETNDNTRLNTKLGVNTQSEAFHQQVESYYTANPAVYWTLLSGINNQFQAMNVQGAGALFAEFITLVANEGAAAESFIDV